MKDSAIRTVSVAGLLCMVCAVGVSIAAVALKPVQEKNKALDKKKNILMAAGLMSDSVDVDQVFADKIRAKVIDLSTGGINEDMDPTKVDERKLAADPKTSTAIDPGKDIAGIRRRANVAVVYEVYDNNQLQQVVLPVHGKGLWSTLYGFLAVNASATEVNGIGFYEHAETPGLGGEVDNPKWKAIWKGKKLMDDNGELRIEVLKGAVDKSRPEAVYQVDGLAGATLTTRGVHNLIRYWLGEEAFATYLSQLTKGGASS